MPTISVATVAIQKYYNILDYIPHAKFFILITYFIIGSLYLFIPFTYFTHPDTSPPLWQPPVCSVCLCLFFLDAT